MHENMCVCEQGEHHFLLDFVLSSCVHRLPVHAQSLHARVCHSCLLVLPLCVCSCVHSCGMQVIVWEFIRGVSTCVFMCVCICTFSTSRT